MENEKGTDLIPEQKTGAQSNTESSVLCNSIEESKEFYQKVKQRLLRVNDWQSYAGILTATFQLTDAQGRDVERTAQREDHFKIDIPGPGSVTGDGFDWVRIEEIAEQKGEEEESIIIKVHPATNPTNDHNDVAHFFSEEATSCFMVKREGTTILAAVYGRNENPNTTTEKVVDKTRNVAVATGATVAFAKLQWKSLVTGLLRKED